MYEHVGRKIKSVAEWINVLGVFISVLIGIIIIGHNEDNFLAGLLVIGIGAIISWLSTLLLYGFGQLIDDTATIREATVAMQRRKQEASFGDDATAATGDHNESDLGFCTHCGAPRTDIGAYCSSCGHSFYE